MVKFLGEFVEVGVYGNDIDMMLVDHPSYGRLILIQGYGGDWTKEGTEYSYLYGKAIQLQPDEDTCVLEGMWSEHVSNYVAIVNGWDDQHPLLDIPGYEVQAIAALAKLDERNVFNAHKKSNG